ncbi:MAG: hypothetical protein WA821_14120 [Anaerolineales bacterium]
MFRKLVLVLSLIVVLIMPTGIVLAGQSQYDGEIKKPNGDVEF